MHFPEAGASQDQIEMFGLSLAPLVNRANVSNSLLLSEADQSHSAHRRRADQARLGRRKDPRLSGFSIWRRHPTQSLAAERRRLS